MQRSVIIPCNQCGSNFYCYFEEGTPVPEIGICEKCKDKLEYNAYKKEVVVQKPKEIIKQDKTIYIMASGPSINDITEGQWRYLKTQHTLGISHFYKKNWEPTYYFSLEQTEHHSQIKMILNHYIRNNWKTELYFNREAEPWVKITVPFTWVSIGDWQVAWDGGYWSTEDINPPCSFDKVWAKTLKDKLFVYRGTTMGAINLATVLGAIKIVLCGVDMNDESHFYNDVPRSVFLENMRRERGYDDKIHGHSTNLVLGGFVRGICDAFKWISNNVDIKCASKGSYLVKNGIFEYEDIPSA